MTLQEPVLDPAAAVDPLGVVELARERAGEAFSLASRHLDPSLVDMLAILGFDRAYVSASGSHLYDGDGRAYLDMHTGEGFASLGHNHPDVAATLNAAMAAELVDGVQIHFSALSGLLAEALSARLPAGLDAVFFSSAGAEAVDTAIKFARAATGRPRLLSCDAGYHGVTLGPLSMVGDEFFTEGFGPLLPGCDRVPFGDLDALAAQLAGRDVAAFFVEPIQGREVTLPPPGYLAAAAQLCREHGTLLVADEIQTGLGRTGRWFAAEHDALVPDIVTVGKALSGGYMPVAATVMRRELFQAAVGTLERSYVHQSTYGRNRLSMAAGLATLRIIERDALVENAERIGAHLRDGLTEIAARRQMVAEVRGRGLMIGIELQAPRSRRGRIGWRLAHLASEGLFPQLIVIPLHRDHHVITMASGKNDVIKLLPPLSLSQSEADRFLTAFDAVLAESESSSSHNWTVVRDIALQTLRRQRAGEPGVAPPRARADHAEPADGGGRPVAPGRRPAAPAGASAPSAGAGDTYLVTGASGFIGGHVARRLAEAGHRVRGLVRPTSHTAGLRQAGVQLVTGDLADPASIARAVTGCRFVVHCGALVSDWATREEITRVNVDGTRHVAQAAAAAGVQRLVHLSSTDVYGHPGRGPIDESFRGGPWPNRYGESKLASESEIAAAAAETGLEAVVLRPATVYGPGSDEVIGQIARAIQGRHMLLIGRGATNAGLLYVENLIDAILLALEHPAAVGQTFNLTDGLPVTWRRLTDDLAAGLGAPPVRLSLPSGLAVRLGAGLEDGYRALRRTTGLTLPPLLSRQAVGILARDQDFSAQRARERLGWEPRVGYADGLARTLRWLQDDWTEASPHPAAPARPGG
jgi:ornithine--oxo-acid transaminase